MIGRRDGRFVFPADEVHGVHRYDPEALKKTPATVAKSTPVHTRGVLEWGDKSVGCLDEDALFSTFNRSLAMKTQDDDLGDIPMLELFRIEVEGQAAVLAPGLLAIERAPASPAQLEELMRAAHSLKGAASIVGLDPAVRVAHAMEDCFVAAQEGTITLGRREIDGLLAGVDLLSHIAGDPEAETDVTATVGMLETLLKQGAGKGPEPAAPAAVKPDGNLKMPQDAESSTRVLRVAADNLNRLLGLAGESLVESRWPRPFAEGLLRLKRMQSDLGKSLEGLRESLGEERLSETAGVRLSDALRQVSDCRQFLTSRLAEIDRFDRRSANLSHRLYREVLDCRMRPFGDGVHAFPRMIRDLSRTLGKEARLEITGEATEVDRDVLEKLEAPLTHLLRNALDHGIEAPAERERAGKPAEGVIRLEARHASGTLLIIVSDDGCGIDPDAVRRAVIARKLATPGMVEKLSEAELMDFLFLPGFTMKEEVTEISGRGVGLDVVRAMVKEVRGTIHIAPQPGAGARFQLQLPLTLSVLRTLLVEVAGEPYAFPLAHIQRALKLPRGKIESLEGRQHFALDGQRIGLVTAHQVLDCGEAGAARRSIRGRARRAGAAVRAGGGSFPRRTGARGAGARSAARRREGHRRRRAHDGRLAGPHRRCRGPAPVH